MDLMKKKSLTNGMNILIIRRLRSDIMSNSHIPVKAVHVFIQNKLLHIVLSDGRQIATPLSWYEKLANATDEELKNWEISPSGVGIHWPDLDEDISIRPMLSTEFLRKDAA